MLFNQPTLTVHAMGRLKNIPDLLSADVMSFYRANPLYEEAVKRNRRTAGIPKEQKYFHIEGDELLFPRGAIRPVVGLCAKHGVKLQVTDNRSEGVLKTFRD